MLTYAAGVYPKLNFKNRKTFSIIIPYRNEIDYIEKNYYFLRKQIYDKNRYELIYVNDHSSDGSENFFNNKINIKKIDLDMGEKGKFEAIKRGFKEAKNEYLILTDCDCYGNEKYINSINQVLNPDDVLYAGFFEIEDSKLLSLDTFFLVGIASALNFFNMPSSCPGANICVKKDIYEKFIKNSETSNNLTEDALLLNTIKKEKMGNIHFIFDENNILKTRGYDSIPDFLNQRLRWLKGGFNLDYRLLIFLGFNFISNLLFLINIEYLFIPFVMIFFFLFCILKRLKRLKYILYYPLYFLLYFMYTIVLGIIFLFRLKNIKWKGRIYKK
jgi:cellulose synthase/poly-beta-1,6-N-acetylglucosamine synthase-like glycosyltransferase